MLKQDDDFQRLMERIRRGDDEAVQLVVEKYGPHICRAVRRRFRHFKLRILYGTDDCLQSVWATVFSNPDALASIESQEHLVRYLAKLAANKLISKDRQLQIQRNDVRRDQSLPDERSWQEGLEDRSLRPSEWLLEEDEWEHRAGFLSSTKREILELYREGHTCDEIAEKTTRSGRGVRRILSRITQFLQLQNSESQSET